MTTIYLLEIRRICTYIIDPNNLTCINMDGGIVALIVVHKKYIINT